MFLFVHPEAVLLFLPAARVTKTNIIKLHSEITIHKHWREDVRFASHKLALSWSRVWKNCLNFTIVPWWFIMRKAPWSAAWRLNKTTSQSPYTYPPSVWCLPVREERINECKGNININILCAPVWRWYLYLFSSFSTAIRSWPRHFSTAAWCYMSWWLYLQARHFWTEVLFTHPHMSEILRSVHATSCSCSSPFLVVITYPRGSGWMRTALTCCSE